MLFWNSLDFWWSMDVGNLISVRSAFSKIQLGHLEVHNSCTVEAWLGEFEHYFASMWEECNCVVVWTFFVIGMKTDLFQSCGHCWVFQICWHIECSTFTASSFRIWNRSAGIPSPPLAFFVVMLSNAHFTLDWFQLGKGVRQGCILLCRVHHVKCWAGWSTSWYQDCWQKYQGNISCKDEHNKGQK